MTPIRSKFMYRSMVMLLAFCIFQFPPEQSRAEDVNSVLNQINKDLRQAQNDMFAGNTDKAIAALDKIQERIAKVRALDPKNRRIDSLEKKYLKLVKDLERRTGKKLGGATLTAADTSSQTDLPVQPTSQAVTAEPTATSAVSTKESDVKALVTEAKQHLRQAEKSMFNGNNQKARQQLTQAMTVINKIRTADPQNSRLTSLENTHGQIQKKLEAKVVPESSRDSLPPEVKTAETPSVNSGKIPYAARKPLADATRQLRGLDTLLIDLADPDDSGNKDLLMNRINGRLEQAESSLDQAKALAAQKGVVSHPDFERIDADLSVAQKKVAQAKGRYKEAKATVAAKSEEVNADIKNLQLDYDRVSSLFEQATGNVIYYNDLDPVGKLIAHIEEFEKNELARLKTKISAFAQKYGSTQEEIDKKAESMGYSGRSRASFAYTELVKGIDNIRETRAAMAEDLVKKANEMFDRVKTGPDFFVVEQFAKVKAWLSMASRYDSENPKVKEALTTIDDRITKGMNEFHARIDKRTWPKHAANAPKNTEVLAEAALGWFKNSPGWGKHPDEARQPLAVVITGPWSIQKKNILGEPIMYGLPILLAVQVDRDRELNVARVYTLTMRTAEMRGVKMEPPFDHVTVGNSYFIRLNKVK